MGLGVNIVAPESQNMRGRKKRTETSLVSVFACLQIAAQSIVKTFLLKTHVKS